MAKLYFRYGAMNSGKSTFLLQVAHNYEEKGMKVLLFKPKVDVKGGDTVVSRLGVSRKVDHLIEKKEKVLDLVNKSNLPDAILIDEAQFLEKEQVDDFYYMSKMYNVPILAYGLRNDFLLNTFEGSQRLLALADTIEELKTICKCGKKATQNMRLLNNVPVFDGDSILIDGTSDYVYEPVCGECYFNYYNGNHE